MASFSRPVNEDASNSAGSSEQVKRTRTISSKLTNSDNISKDAKKRTLEQAARGNIISSTSSKPAPVQQKIPFASQTKTNQPNNTPPSTRHSSVDIEEIPDEDSSPHRHAGPPKNPLSLLEASDGSDDDEDLPQRVVPQATQKRQEPAAERDVSEEPVSKKQKSETAEEELGEWFANYIVII